MSFPVKSIDFGAPEFAVTVCAFAVGASFTGLTVIETIATLLSAEPSLTLKLKLSLPL